MKQFIVTTQKISTETVKYEVKALGQQEAENMVRLKHFQLIPMATCSDKTITEEVKHSKEINKARWVVVHRPKKVDGDDCDDFIWSTVPVGDVKNKEGRIAMTDGTNPNNTDNGSEYYEVNLDCKEAVVHNGIAPISLTTVAGTYIGVTTRTFKKIKELTGLDFELCV